MAICGNEKIRLKPKQREAIAALLTERSVAAAAQAVGVGLRTLHRWLKEDEAFIAELRAAERVIDDETTRRIVSLQTQALEAIGAVFTSEAATHSERLRAAEMVLAQRIRLRELGEIEERLAALEQQLGAR